MRLPPANDVLKEVLYELLKAHRLPEDERRLRYGTEGLYLLVEKAISAHAHLTNLLDEQ